MLIMVAPFLDYCCRATVSDRIFRWGLRHATATPLYYSVIMLPRVHLNDLFSDFNSQEGPDIFYVIENR